MSRFLITAIALLTFATADAQQFVCSEGKIHFFSKAPIEDIEATSTKTVCALNTSNKKVYAKIPIKSFEFRDKLMQEHFNENYLESHKFPYATLDAVIKEDIDFTKDGTYDVTLIGTLEIHGVKQQREIKGKLTIKGGLVYMATSVFDVMLVDHKIKIPKAVIMNIAEVIKVDIEFTFVKYEPK